MLLDINQVAENALTLLILVGFGYLIYYGFKTKGHAFDFKKIFSGRLFGGNKK